MVEWYQKFPSVAKRELTQRMTMIEQARAERERLLREFLSPILQPSELRMLCIAAEIVVCPNAAITVLQQNGHRAEIRESVGYDVFERFCEIVEKLLPRPAVYAVAEFCDLGLTIEFIVSQPISDDGGDDVQVTFVIENVASTIAALRTA